MNRLTADQLAEAVAADRAAEILNVPDPVIAGIRELVFERDAALEHSAAAVRRMHEAHRRADSADESHGRLLEHTRMQRERAERAEAERDDARAEVARLRGELAAKLVGDLRGSLANDADDEQQASDARAAHGSPLTAADVLAGAPELDAPAWLQTLRTVGAL